MQAQQLVKVTQQYNPVLSCPGHPSKLHSEWKCLLCVTPDMHMQCSAPGFLDLIVISTDTATESVQTVQGRVDGVFGCPSVCAAR